MLKITFVANKCLSFTRESLEQRPLGGTETAIVRLSDELAKRGNQVTVFSAIDDVIEGEGVPTYRPLGQVHQERDTDVLISVRDWMPLMLPLMGRLRFYWTGDSYDQIHNYGIGDRRVNKVISGMILGSNWQADTLSAKSGFPNNKTVVLPLGVHLPYFDGEETRVRKRLIYSSTPYRGLEHVPELYLKVKERHPDAELHIFSGLDVYQGLNTVPEQEKIRYKALDEKLISLPDCTVHGNVFQKQLAREFMKSAVLFYPNTFEETFCITAVEAQAAGCVTVSSAKGALPETVGNSGVLIPGEPGQIDYSTQFVNAVDTLLSNDEYFNQLADIGKQRVQERFNYGVMAKSFEEFLKACMAKLSR